MNKKPMGYWMDFNHCLEAAKQCQTRREFSIRFKSAYKNSLKHNWTDEICAHMTSTQKPRGYWQNKEKCREVISKCKTLLEFRNKYPTAYSVCKKKGWFEELCSNLEVLRDVYKWNNIESIHKEALKYTSRQEFSKNNGAAYAAAHRLNIIDIVCSHMPQKNKYCKRGIYAFEFSDMHVYVGLTYNFIIRKSEHMNKTSSKVYQYIQKSKLQPSFKILHQYTNMEKAALLEGEYLKDYINRGWKPLNIKTPGGLGGSTPYYTHKRVLELARSCETLVEFRKKYDQAYQSARKHNWLNEIKEFLPSSVNQYGSFHNTYENIIQYAHMCKTYREFCKGIPSAIAFAKRNGFIEDIYKILPPTRYIKKITSSYRKEDIMNLLPNCHSYSEFRNKYPSAYNAARQKGWLNNIQKYLPPQNPPQYTLDKIIQIANKCDNYAEFYQKYGGAYNSALQHDWLENIRQIFNKKKHLHKYIYNDIITLAKECNSYDEFRKLHPNAYRAAKRNNWCKDLKKAFPTEIKTIYTKEYVIEIASLCSSYKDFAISHPSIYQKAHRMGWINDIEQILPRSINKAYTKDEIVRLAKTCNTYTQFTKNHRYAYKAACNKGWIDDIKQIIPCTTHPPYTKNDIIEIAQKCTCYQDFRENHTSAYVKAMLKGWLNDVQNILPITKPKPYTREIIWELATKSKSYTSFAKEYRNAYKAACKMKIQDKLKLFFQERE